MVKGVPTKGRGVTVVQSLNYIWPLERAYASATDVGDDPVDDDYGTSFQDDVDALVRVLGSRGLTTPHDLTGFCRINLVSGNNITHEYYPNAEVWRTNQDLDAYLAEKTAPRRW